VGKKVCLGRTGKKRKIRLILEAERGISEFENQRRGERRREKLRAVVPMKGMLRRIRCGKVRN